MIAQGVLRGPGVASYRIYRLDQYGRIAGCGDDFPFSCDREALGHAQSMAEHYPGVEVWHGTRRVGRVSAAGGEEGQRPTSGRLRIGLCGRAEQKTGIRFLCFTL
jgi:hypothetical protein